MEPTYEYHLSQIKARVLARLQELGIEDQLPSDGVLRIIGDVHMEYWGELEEGEDAGPFFQEVMELELKDDDGQVVAKFQVSESEDALYFRNHRITVEHGLLQARHKDDSHCYIGCTGCKTSRPSLVEADGEFYVMCLNCHTSTEMMDSKWQAIGLWLVGVVEQHHDN